jgi:hypothetical protein
VPRLAAALTCIWYQNSRTCEGAAQQPVTSQCVHSF